MTFRARLTRTLLALLVASGLATATLMTATAPEASAASTEVKVMTTFAAPVEGEKSAIVKALQKRLVKARALSSQEKVTSYYGDGTVRAVKRFQRAQHLRATGAVDKRTWRRLVAKTGTVHTITAAKVRKLPKKCKVTGRVLCADKTTSKLYFLVDGTLVKTMDARFGCNYDNRATRNGTFEIQRKAKHWVSTIYHTAMPFSMFFSGGQAVHYSADFAARGYNGCSHGCVNIRDYDGLAWVYSKMRVGDRVAVYYR